MGGGRKGGSQSRSIERKLDMDDGMIESEKATYKYPDAAT